MQFFLQTTTIFYKPQLLSANHWKSFKSLGNFLLEIASIFHKLETFFKNHTQLFSTNHNFFLQLTNFSVIYIFFYDLDFFLQATAFFCNLQLFSTNQNYFLQCCNIFPQITTFFYNVAVISCKFHINFLQSYLNDFAKIRRTREASHDLVLMSTCPT